MKTIDLIRRENLARLARDCGGQKHLSDLLKKSPAQISQWINASKDSKTGKPRTMQNETARAIETKLGLERGWLDRDADAPPLSVAEPAAAQVAERIFTPAELRALEYVAILPPTALAEWFEWAESRARLVREALEHHGAIQRQGQG